MKTEPISPVPADASQSGMSADPSKVAGGDEQDTVQVPLSAIADSQPGDSVAFKVISRDEQNGTATLAPTTDETETPGGSDGMAHEFQSPTPKGA